MFLEKKIRYLIRTTKPTAIKSKYDRILITFITQRDSYTKKGNIYSNY